MFHLRFVSALSQYVYVPFMSRLCSSLILSSVPSSVPSFVLSSVSSLVPVLVPSLPSGVSFVPSSVLSLRPNRFCLGFCLRFRLRFNLPFLLPSLLQFRLRSDPYLTSYHPILSMQNPWSIVQADTFLSLKLVTHDLVLPSLAV